MHIPDQFIEELVERCDLADLVGEYVHLTPKGGSLWGCCPFHSENTPSFHVIPERHMFKCFGCGKGGGPLNFIMEAEHVTYPDAIHFLARRLGMQVPEHADGGDDRERRRRCIEANTAAARFFRTLLNEPGGEAVRDYIAARQISPRFSARFGLGAAPDEWDVLLTALTRQGFSKEELLEAGLCVPGKKGGIYDKFRARLMLPVINTRGEVAGFTSRILPGREGAKYLNSPDTPAFKKSQLIYGLSYARRTKRSNLILVEGNLDVITLHQAGFDNAIATMGTAMTAEHVNILKKYKKELVICYDNDAAGKQSTGRVLELLRGSGLAVRVLQLPNAVDADGNLLKQDPDDFIKRYGPTAFERCLDGSAAQNDYRIEELQRTHDLETEDGRLAFLRAAVETVGKLESAIEREVYGNKAAVAAGITGAAFAQEVERWRKDRSRKARRQEIRRALTPAVALQPRDRTLHYDNLRSARAEEGVIRLIQLDPAFLERADITPADFSCPLYGKAFQIFQERHAKGLRLHISVLSGEFTVGEMNQLTDVAMQAESVESVANGEQAMRDYVQIIRSEAAERRAPRDADALMAFRARQRDRKKAGDGI